MPNFESTSQKKRNSAPVPWLILCVFSLEKLNKQIIIALRTTYVYYECRKRSLNLVKHFGFGLCQRWNHKRWWNQGCFFEGKTKYVSFLKGFFSILECWNMWITKMFKNICCLDRRNVLDSCDNRSYDRQSYHLQKCKFYENFSEYANFSKASG